MLTSETKQYIFLSNPKTGTTAIQNKIRGLDSTAVMNRLKVKGETTKFPEHGNALLLQAQLRKDIEKYQVFTFVRDPYEKIVSAYFFYKNGEPLVHKNLLWYWRKGLRNMIKASVSYLNVLFARSIPFYMWSLLRRVKSNEKYLVDQEGIFIVNYIGQTENLSSDFSIIIQKLGIVSKAEKVSHLNASSHNKSNTYYNRKWHLNQIRQIYQRELSIYKLIQSKPADFNYKGKNINDLLKEN
jgi:hypothetical protein